MYRDRMIKLGEGPGVRCTNGSIFYHNRDIK